MNELESVTNITRIGEPSANIIKVAASLPPRDLVKVESDIRNVLINNPELAEICIYCRPVGKKDGKQQFALGPSVRFTEIGQQCFGRMWVNGYSDTDAKRVLATVACFDLHTLNITFGTCSKSIIGRGGQKYNQNMIEVTTNAALSIARRNALLQQMRVQLEATIKDAKNTVIKKWCKDGEQKNDEAWKAIADDYKKRWGTSNADLKKLVENEGSPEDKIIMAIGVRNYLIDNPDGYNDVFGKPPAPQPKGKNSNSGPGPSINPKQEYNTLVLQLNAANKEMAAVEIVNGYCEKIAKGLDEFNDEDYKELNKELEGELKNGK